MRTTRFHLLLLLLAGSSSVPALATPLSTGKDPDTGLRYWHWQEKGVSFKLTQRLPDQTRAFFAARGFDKPTREQIALACVFQSEFRNTAGQDKPPVEYDLSQWQVQFDGETRSLNTREVWQGRWQDAEISQSARIAFEWALLPTYQVYQAKDYNWGMTSYGLPPGSKFDLQFSWQRGKQRYTRQIDNIECAPDIHPEPE